MTAGIVPITSKERRGRIEKARRLMAENHLDAVILEGGSSMFYFTGVRWGLSERPFIAVLPAKGEMAWVSPAFEEERARELIEIGGKDVRTWEEADQEADRCLEPRASRPGGRVRGDEARRAVRSGRRGGAQGHHRRRLRARLQGSRPAASDGTRHRPGRP
jgi:Xaa-Pro aminopeptidase